MKGIVIHHQGKVRRALEGRTTDGRLEIETITPVPFNQDMERLGCATRRPIYFTFSFGGRPFAASQNVMLAKGRRYPDVEHWFIMSEPERQLKLPHAKQTSAAPA